MDITVRTATLNAACLPCVEFEQQLSCYGSSMSVILERWLIASLASSIFILSFLHLLGIGVHTDIVLELRGRVGWHVLG